MTVTEDDPRTTELRALMARMERLIGPLTAEQRTAVDSYGNPAHVAPGELIESEWGNAVVDHSILIFPDETTLNATWFDAPEGAIAQAPVGTFWIRQDGAWTQRGTGLGMGGQNAILTLPAISNSYADVTYVDTFGVFPIQTLSRIAISGLYIRSVSNASAQAQLFSSILSPQGGGGRMYAAAGPVNATGGTFIALGVPLMGEEPVPANTPGPSWLARFYGNGATITVDYMVNMARYAMPGTLV